MHCGICGSPAVDGQRYCSGCGAKLPAGAGRPPSGDSGGETHLASNLPREPAGRTPSSGWLSSAESIDHGRFGPGAMVAGRYRVIGLLGRGGMGEVYRADDLRLGQPVALKFLPATLATDAQRLAQFHNEVRMARQVAHPNVCRVYDIGEFESALFLTMEYVDGEDLGASLRRLGRLPEDRALALARQICAGLAAAHERGIVHRDLKPSNIMIDAEGRARIMDFGLAAAGVVTGERAGTPAYMAPEQIEGRTVTSASDIYALGLVLYELFTGRRAFTAATLADLVLQKASGSVTPPTSIVAGMDVVIERTILRCLDRDPAVRPSTALAVSGLLPGGDPIAEALAAGQLPSPAMVAAAGGEGAALGARAGALWMGTLVALVLLAGWMADRATVAGQTHLRKPAAVLAEYARQIRASAGYPETAVYEAWGFGYNSQELRWYAAHGGPQEDWRGLDGGSIAPLRFWYRASSRRLDAVDPLSEQGPGDPPLAGPGDSEVVLDARARLISFEVQPPATLGAVDPLCDWAPFFKAAGLDARAFVAAATTRRPPFYADSVLAFSGSLPGLKDAPVRIEAASLGGQPIAFSVLGPWTQSDAAPQPGAWLLPGLALAKSLLEVGLIVLAVWLAVTNVRAGRVDRGTALRLALFAIGVYLTAWILRPAHSGDPAREAYRFFANFGFALFYGVIFGAAYLGFEPYVRRYSPRALVGWTRLVAGRVRDAVVGRDVLIGIASGLVIAVVMFAYQVVPRVLGRPSPPGWLAIPTQPADGLAAGLSYWVLNINLSFISSFAGMFLIAVVRRYVPITWLVVVVASMVLALIDDFAVGTGYDLPVRLLAMSVVVAAPLVVVLLRWGLLAGVVASFVWNLVTDMVFTLDPARPYFAFSLLSAGLVVAFGLAGWRLARARRAATAV